MRCWRGAGVHDFGDGWDHTIKLEEIVSAIRASRPFSCSKRSAAAALTKTPADRRGYERLPEIIADLEDVEHEAGMDRFARRRVPRSRASAKGRA